MQLLLLPGLFYAGAKVSLALAIMPEVLVMLWVPNSILLAALFHYGMRRYGYFAAAIIAAEVAADYPSFSVLESVLFGSINLLEVSFAYWLLQRWRFNPRFAAPIDLVKFVTAAAAIASFAAAGSAAGVYTVFRGAETGYLTFLRVWWFSDSLGLLILTPLALSLWPPMPGQVADDRAELRWYDGVALVGGLVVLVAFASAYQGRVLGLSIRPVLLLPALLYVAARFSLRTTTVVLMGVAIVVLYVTRNGQQPFGELAIHETAILAQEFLLIMAVVPLSIAALLSQVRANARELELRVQSRTAELSAANARLEKLAVTDSLTGLANRRALFSLLQREIDRAHRHRHDLAVIMFDIDEFKLVNDRHGHAAGDAVLRHIAAVTARVIRSTDTLARYGGEEFVLVAPETRRAHAVHMAERMRESLRSTDVAVNHGVLRVTASFGVATLRGDDRQPESLLRRADEALYAAKAEGRDRVMAEPVTEGA